MNWYLEVKIWAEDRQCSSCLLIQETKVTKILNILTSLYQRPSAIRAQRMEEAPRRGILGWYWSCDQKRINILSNTIECNYSSRDTSSPLYFKKVERLKTGEILYERPYLSPRPPPKISLRHESQLDQREWSIGFYCWTTAQLGKLVNSHFERSNLVLNFPNQPHPNPIQSVIDRGNRRTQERVFVEKGKNVPFTRDRWQTFAQRTLDLQIEQGKPVKSEDNRVMHAHDGTGELVKSSASTHTVEEFGSAEHRDIASANADNEFNRATDEGEHWLQHPRECRIQQWNDHTASTFTTWFRGSRNYPQRQALQSDLQQHRAFNPFSKESQDVIKAAGNHWTMRDTRCWAKSTMQSMPRVLGRWHRPTARTDTSCEMTQQKTRSTSSPFLISSLSRSFTSGRVDHTVTGTGRKKVIKNTTLQINSKRSA